MRTFQVRPSDAAFLLATLALMAAPPIPQRMRPLSWRKPAFLWTPVALLLAIGWPGALFYGDQALQELALISGAIVFAVALITLGASWALGRAPRTRRTVVMHVLIAGAIAAMLAPFVLTRLLSTVADYAHAGSASNFSIGMSMAMAPLALLLGLPLALSSALIFAWIALVRPPPPEATDLLDDGVFRSDVQPFR